MANDKTPKKKAKSKKAEAKAKLAKLRAKAGALREKLAAAETALSAAEGKTPGVSPFAQPFPTLPLVGGVRFASVAAGVRYKGRLDVMMAEITGGSAFAGVFTRSATRAAPVDWCRQRLADLRKRPLKGPLTVIVNAGNANAFTGDNGMTGVEDTAKAAAKALKASARGVFISSTGVIGEPLATDRITSKMDKLAASLSPEGIEDAAKAIMTTDTFHKGAGRTIELDGVTYNIAGIAKGSGMIAPDMATMLAYVFTDAPIGQALLQSMLKRANEVSFNAATVDSDTSTSDTVLAFATGAAGGRRIASARDARAKAFQAAFTGVLADLAQQIVKDGEGATKFVRICIEGAKSDRSARIIARAIANSPLVKTAIAGEDPNWGRVVMAVGKSGQPADRDRLSIRFGDIVVAENGWVSDSYRERDGAKYMKRSEIVITADLAIGEGRSEVWTCDLTHGYIAINADYRS